PVLLPPPWRGRVGVGGTKPQVPPPQPSPARGEGEEERFPGTCPVAPHAEHGEEGGEEGEANLQKSSHQTSLVRQGRQVIQAPPGAPAPAWEPGADESTRDADSGSSRTPKANATHAAPCRMRSTPTQMPMNVRPEMGHPQATMRPSRTETRPASPTHQDPGNQSAKAAIRRNSP